MFSLFSCKFFLHLLRISLEPLIFPYSAQILLGNALFCCQKTLILLSKIPYSARNSAGRIYPSLTIIQPGLLHLVPGCFRICVYHDQPGPDFDHDKPESENRNGARKFLMINNYWMRFFRYPESKARSR